MNRTITFLLLFLILHITAQCWQSTIAGYEHLVAAKSDGTLWASDNNVKVTSGNEVK